MILALWRQNLTRRSQRRWIEATLRPKTCVELAQAEGDYCDDVTVAFVAPEVPEKWILLSSKQAS